MNPLLFFVGFFILVKGAQFLVDGASAISLRLGISEWVIGVLVVGIGTSIPEFSITVVSALQGSDIGIGTLLGGNTFNILFVIGISALISPALIRKDWVRKDFILNALSVLIAGVFLLLPIVGDRSYIGITFEEACILFALFILWVGYMLKRNSGFSVEYVSQQKGFGLLASMSMIFAGFIGVFFGADWVVSGAVSFADMLGISAYAVGLSILALGTSIPEITVSLVAASRGRTEIAIGNIIGSNIFDFLGIIGTAGLIAPITFDPHLSFDVVVTMMATLALVMAMFVGYKRYVLSRSEGLVFALIYCLYFVTIILRAPF